jgi:hypothetical protein
MLSYREYWSGNYRAAIDEAVRTNAPYLFWLQIVLAAPHGQLGEQQPASAAVRALMTQIPSFFSEPAGHPQHMAPGGHGGAPDTGIPESGNVDSRGRIRPSVKRLGRSPCHPRSTAITLLRPLARLWPGPPEEGFSRRRRHHAVLTNQVRKSSLTVGDGADGRCMSEARHEPAIDHREDGAAVVQLDRRTNPHRPLVFLSPLSGA